MVNTFPQLIDRIIGVLNLLVILIITLGVVYFLYGIMKYIIRYGDETARTESIKIMTRGVVAIFVMIAVWGLTELVLTLIGERIGLPQLN